MTKIILIALMLFVQMATFGQTNWQTAYNNDITRIETIYDNITINKEECTITKDGKTFHLYGKIQFVDNWPDIKIQIVDNWPDIKVKIVDNWPDSCGKFQVVDSWPDLKVQIVDNWADIKVKIVDNWPGF
ncbi:MAG: hypothetical protein II939_16040 [Bacteroidales bacterium]|nr:hypothetical protein [Bacteroidales bacterium]